MTKILHLVKYYHPSAGGMETYVRQLCEGLQGNRFSHQVLTFHHNKKLPSVEQKVNGVTVTRIQPQVIWLSQPFSIDFRKTFIKKINQFDLVHLHFPFPQAENLVKSITQPLVVTWCVDPAKTRWKILAWLARPHYKTLVKKANMIVAIGHGVIKNSLLLNNSLKKCCTIPLSFSKKQSRRKAAYRTRFKKQFRVLFVGRLRKYKGLKYLVKAVSLSSKNIVLNIVGDGEEKESICSLISKYNLSQRVKLLGTLSENQKNIAYQNCDAFCLPSIHEAEGFGIVQAEAMSYGIFSH